jgi:hypothetical protein
MPAGKRRWLPIVAGILALVGIVVIGVGAAAVLWLRDQVQVDRRVDDGAARTAFDDARRRFADTRPLLEMGDDRRPRLALPEGAPRNPGTVTAVRVLAWDAGDRALATVTLPMWLLRLKTGPIVFGEYVSGMDVGGVRLEPRDLERYGPGIVADIETPDGDRVLIVAE